VSIFCTVVVFSLLVDAGRRGAGRFIISARPSKQPRMGRTFLKVYKELGSYFLFLQEQIKDIIII
jgi:hypothetical protein